MKVIQKIKYIPTWKIKEILDSPNCTGIDGKDYHHLKSELENEYRSRLEKLDQLEHERLINQYNESA